MEILTKPLRITALKKLLKNKGRLTVNIGVSLSDLINRNMNEFNELVEERVIDKDVMATLSDIGYSVVGHIPGSVDKNYMSGGIIIQVNADVDIFVFKGV